MSAQFKRPMLILEEKTHKRLARRRSRKKRGVLLCLTALLLCMGGSYWLVQSGVLAALGHRSNHTSAFIYGEKLNTNPRLPTNGTPLIAPARPYTGNSTAPVAVPVPGQDELIIVSISKQQLTAYNNGVVVFTTLVTTGKITLQTPQGTFHVMDKLRNIMMYSKWPPSSPNYYAPEHANYALQITNTGIYLHDATWRSVFGPGTEFPHNDPVFGPSDGSHGCVNLPLSAAQWLYYWTGVGTPVEIVP